MDQGSEDNPPPQAEQAQTVSERLKTEFTALPPAEQRHLARSLFFDAYQLPTGWTEYLDKHLVNPAKEAFGDNNTAEPVTSSQTADATVGPSTTAEPQQEVASQETKSALEDELAASVKNISIFTKLPTGLVINGQDITEGHDTPGGAYQNFSPDNWKFSNWKSRGNKMIGFFGNLDDVPAFPNTAFITEEPNPANTGYTVITFGFNIDKRVREIGNKTDGSKGRPVNIALVSLNLPTEKAKEFLRLVKELPDGADFAERFLQKTLPNALDGELESPGLKRENTTGLVVLDEDALRGFFSSPEQITNHSNLDTTSERQFQQYVRQNLERKKYSSPVGILDRVPDEPKIATELQQQAASPESESSLEDEIIPTIKNIGFWGKFPHGLSAKGTELVAPHTVTEDFSMVSPDGWKPYYSINDRTLRLNGYLKDSRMPYLEMSIISEEPNPNEQGFTVINYLYRNDSSVRDASRRLAPMAIISFNLPTASAKRFINEVKTRPDGADLVEKFLQKTVPDAFAKDLDSNGIRRARSTELLVIDDAFQREFLGDEFADDYKTWWEKLNLSSNDPRHDPKLRDALFYRSMELPQLIQTSGTRKPYSIPVGIGTATDR